MKSAFQNIVTFLKIKDFQTTQVSFILFIVTIPLPFAFNNIALVLFLISLFFYKRAFLFNKSLFLLVLMFALFLISYVWSIDNENTLKALPRSLVLLLLPLGFMFYGHISDNQKKTILSVYSLGILGVVVYYMVKAVVRYILTFDTEVFFYHGQSYEINQGLVPKDLNAIHVSVFVSLAYFVVISQKIKSKLDYLILGFFTLFIFLLSSKNILLVFGLLNLVYLFYFSTSAYKMRLRNLLLFASLIIFLFIFGKIKDRIAIEFADHTTKSISHHVIQNIPESVNILSIREAWEKEKFTPNDFFPGTAFRIYQFRLFLDFLKEDQIFWTGFGYAVSQSKIEQKGKQYNVFLGDETHEGYQQKNFHNQFIQIFAEVGVVGLLLLLLMLAILFKKGIKNKDFIIISFVILMFSVFLTESFLWRQRGMVFFVTFLCLFLSNKSDEKALSNKLNNL